MINWLILVWSGSPQTGYVIWPEFNDPHHSFRLSGIHQPPPPRANGKWVECLCPFHLLKVHCFFSECSFSPLRHCDAILPDVFRSNGARTWGSDVVARRDREKKTVLRTPFHTAKRSRWRLLEVEWHSRWICLRCSRSVPLCLSRWAVIASRQVIAIVVHQRSFAQEINCN